MTALGLGEALVTASFDYGGKPYTATIKIIVAEGNKDVVVTSVKFPDGELLISTGDTYVLSKQVTPKNGYVTDITYTSSNNSVVEVSNNGEIKAKKVGVATIKMSVNNGKFEDEMTINVVSKKVEPQMIVKLETIQFNESSVSMKIGETKKLAYQTLPSDAYIDDLEWSSSNNSVASVDQNGNVTAKSSGSAVITVKGMNNLEATIVVNVAKGVVNVTSLRILSATNLTLNVNQTSIIVVDVSPYDATDKSVTYTSTSPSVASVENGTIRALTQGTTTIIVRTNDGGYSASINVTVVNSSGGSSGSGSGSSGSSGGSSSCTSNDLIRIDSDSGDAISTNKEGNGKTATKSVITIDTSLIGKYASCGTIETLKYCYTNYTGADCTPETEFKVGDKIKMNVPNGEGIMQIRIKASVNNGAEYTKTYYMKYKVDGTSDGSSDDNQDSSSFSLSINTDKISPSVGDWLLGEVRYTITFTANKEIKNIYYCDGGDDGECIIKFTSTSTAIKTGAGEYYSNNNLNQTFIIAGINKKTFENVFKVSLNNHFCFAAVDANGNQSSKGI